METTMPILALWSNAIESAVPLWRSWSILSQYQKQVWENYCEIFCGHFERFLQLAPTTLSQTINPWSFSLVQFTNQIKGRPSVERKIITEVAGYGSQLGTIMDFLEVVEKTTDIDPDKIKDSGDRLKVDRFRSLVRDINRAKGTPIST